MISVVFFDGIILSPRSSPCQQNSPSTKKSLLQRNLRGEPGILVPSVYGKRDKLGGLAGMAISFKYFTFAVDGVIYAVKPDGVSFGDGESVDIAINGGSDGTVTNIPITKKQVTLSVEGVTDIDIARIQNKRDENIRDLINRRAVTQDLNFGGYVIEKSLITQFTPSAPKIVDGIGVFDKMDIVFSSQVFA
jgi:predicted ester cyclase